MTDLRDRIKNLLENPRLILYPKPPTMQSEPFSLILEPSSTKLPYEVDIMKGIVVNGSSVCIYDELGIDTFTIDPILAGKIHFERTWRESMKILLSPEYRLNAN